MSASHRHVSLPGNASEVPLELTHEQIRGRSGKASDSAQSRMSVGVCELIRCERVVSCRSIGVTCQHLEATGERPNRQKSAKRAMTTSDIAITNVLLSRCDSPSVHSGGLDHL